MKEYIGYRVKKLSSDCEATVEVTVDVIDDGEWRPLKERYDLPNHSPMAQP